MAALDRPHYVRDELLGPEAWRRLVAHYGGCGYKIPAALVSDRGCKLVALIGERAAQRLIEYGGGCEIYVHAAADEIIEARRRQVIAMRARGMTVAEIAQACTWVARYTERSVFRILAGGDACQASEEETGAA